MATVGLEPPSRLAAILGVISLKGPPALRHHQVHVLAGFLTGGGGGGVVLESAQRNTP